MQTVQEPTAYNVARLNELTAQARASVEASTQHANTTMKDAPKAFDEDDVTMKLYLMGGKYAGFFCLWFAMIAPIILIIMKWE